MPRRVPISGKARKSLLAPPPGGRRQGSMGLLGRWLDAPSLWSNRRDRRSLGAPRRHSRRQRATRI
eukprot:11448581-Alexandrium_andersonii.AAC.1